MIRPLQTGEEAILHSSLSISRAKPDIVSSLKWNKLVTVAFPPMNEGMKFYCVFWTVRIYRPLPIQTECNHFSFVETGSFYGYFGELCLQLLDYSSYVPINFVQVTKRQQNDVNLWLYWIIHIFSMLFYSWCFLKIHENFVDILL